MNDYDDNTLEFMHKLEDLGRRIGEPVDDDTRELLADIQDEFENIKRAAVREGHSDDERLNIQDVLDYGAAVGDDFPDAQRGCEAFASVWFVEQAGYAKNN